MTEAKNTELATFAGGCFWGIEYRFSQISGVVSAISGYMGGQVESPSYKQVCTDQTGHAEVVQVEFDPQIISYVQLLEIFWKIHDPSQLNRQGPDIGTQYRSAIFYHTLAQQEQAQQAINELGVYFHSLHPPKKVETVLCPVSIFWPAEEYHQKYLLKHPEVLCHI